MDQHIKKFYCRASDDSPRGNFHFVEALHDQHGLTWEEVTKKVTGFPRGWFELSHLNVRDRIDFTRDFWLSKLPFHPKLAEGLTQFFNNLDDIGIYIVQKTFDHPFEAHLVYSCKNNSGFFHGNIGASEADIRGLKQTFPDVMFPQDYLKFLEIHNGFSKSCDTGILETYILKECYNRFKTLLEKEDPLTTATNAYINPNSLIPFYESFGMPVYQCFWTDWYPNQEMGNVYYSGITNSISDVLESTSGTENLAFPRFLDWLIFYLEKID